MIFGVQYNKQECSLALDIGTEAVKAVVFEKMDHQYNILSSAVEYFDELKPFDHDKIILKTKEEAMRLAGKSPKELLLSLAPSILKSRVGKADFSRKNFGKIIAKDEAKNITEAALIEIEKEMAGSFAQDYGIMPQDIKFVDRKILEIKIDGYEVSGILGHSGRNLEFKVLAGFLPRGYLKNFDKARIVSPIKNLGALGIADGIFIDIGGEVTQICLIGNNNIEIIDEIALGGKDFSRAISQTLGMPPVEARFFKEKYSFGALADDTRGRTKEILSFPAREWIAALKLKLKTIKGLIPSAFFIFGGGSQLPEIEELITDGGGKVKFVYPKDFKDVVDKTGCVNSLQFTNLVLFIHG
ncbi:MAG: hypothetical protein Q7R84_01730 [bacterium]|nr:hypothetical protein [bacterium]